MLEDDNGQATDSESEDESPVMDLLAALNIDDGAESGSINLDGDQAASKASANAFSRSNPVFKDDTRSSKCIEVLKIVNQILENTSDKIVIVSQWTSMLNIISKYLREDSIKYIELTGKTPINLRNAIVQSFNGKGRERVSIAQFSFQFSLSFYISICIHVSCIPSDYVAIAGCWRCWLEFDRSQPSHYG